MIKLSACIEMIFRDLPVEERIRRVADVGLPAFEFWGWGNKDVDRMAQVKEETGLAVASFAGSAGGPLTDPAKRGDFLKGLEGALEVAGRLGCGTLIVTVGNEQPGMSREAQHQSIVEGLRQAATMAESAGVTLAVEPLNILVNHKGYYLSTSAEGFQIVEEVESERVKLLYDIYHQQITEGNLTATIEAHIGQIAHFHVADVPGRHEPGTGEVNYRNVLRRIDDSGYTGYVGLEYLPLADPAETLRGVARLVE